ncbi:MAG: metalloregulator ArsR/SmtB family transcription factor [Maritimibacter sp.]
MTIYSEEVYVSTAQGLRALAHENRLRIVHWLADPKAHFPPQVDGDLVNDGVCVGYITEKIGLKQPTVTNHMQILQEAGMVESKKIKNWVFYKLRTDRVDAVLEKVGGMY